MLNDAIEELKEAALSGGVVDIAAEAAAAGVSEAALRNIMDRRYGAGWEERMREEGEERRGRHAQDDRAKALLREQAGVALEETYLTGETPMTAARFKRLMRRFK